MKAKEYAKKIQKVLEEDPDNFNGVSDIIKAFLNEWLDVGKSRHIARPRALVSWFKEGQQKWEAVASRIEGTDRFCLNPKGFYIMVKKHFPDLWETFIQSCVMTRTSVPDIEVS